jgi:hypothetical protein
VLIIQKLPSVVAIWGISTSVITLSGTKAASSTITRSAVRPLIVFPSVPDGRATTLLPFLKETSVLVFLLSSLAQTRELLTKSETFSRRFSSA